VTARTSSIDASADNRDHVLVESTIGYQRPRVAKMTPRLLLAAVWLLSAFYMAIELRRGWFAHDEGVLAQSAERVLFGELPHRDFDELYTGGLSYLNAEAFRLFGTNLASMRYMLYIFFLAWVPSLYYASLRFGSPWTAASFTLLAVAWSVPNYSTAMPSWYNLFFATFGVAALFRYIETRQNWWLSVAGLCGGISFLFKLSGLYFVAGSVLFLLFSGAKTGAGRRRWERWSCFALAAFSVLAYEGLVFSLLRKAYYPGSFLYFFLPILAAGAAVVWQNAKFQSREGGFGPTLGHLLLFGAGVAIPVLVFLIPYFRAAAVTDFMRGVFVLPGKRLQYTIRTESLPRFLVGSAAGVACLIAVLFTPRKVRAVAGSVLVASAFVVTVFAGKYPALYDAVWVPVWNFLPVAILMGILLLIKRGDSLQFEQEQKIFLVLAVTAACNLIQFPYSSPMYFCYVAPLLALSVLAASTLVEQPSQFVRIGLFCACLLYAVVDVTPRFLLNRGELEVPASGAADFVLPRSGGLHLYGASARIRTELVNVVLRHARGNYIYATPDCPEVYFLSGFRNPTPTLFDFLDEPTGRTERILAAIHAHDVNLVVLNLAPSFSDPVAPDLREALYREFPEQTHTGSFEVRWKP
jgi:hypothetical protein